MNSEFRQIPSLNNKYEINEDGTILRNAITKKPIKIRLDMHHSKSGYYTAFICMNGKVQRLMIHKLVAECWLGEKPDGLEIDHFDRNSRNNHYTNLRYVDHSTQMKNRKLSSRIIETAKSNCKNYVDSISKNVVIIDEDLNATWFYSETSCAKELSKIYGIAEDTFRRSIFFKKTHFFENIIIVYMTENEGVFNIYDNKEKCSLFTDKIVIAAYYITKKIGGDRSVLLDIIKKFLNNDKDFGDRFNVNYSIF